MMTEEDKKREAAKAKVLKAVEEYVSEMHDPGHMILCASVVYETTSLAEDDRQQYGVQHIMLGTGAMSTHVGIMRVAEQRLLNYMNRRD